MMRFEDLKYKQHTARKAHLCDFCPRPINPKDKYYRFTYINEYTYQDANLHPWCRGEVDWYAKEMAGKTDWISNFEVYKFTHDQVTRVYKREFRRQ